VIHGGWLLSGLTFYGDESGSHPHEGACVLSGYLGSDDDWEDLGNAWREVLHNAGPRIGYFHMYECCKLAGQFEQFNRYQADRKMRDLIDVLIPFLRSNKLREFTAILDWGIYQRTIKGSMREYVFNNPYFLLMHALTIEIAKDLVKRNIQEQVWLWMDDQSAKLEYNLRQQFLIVKELRGPVHGALLHDLAFRDDKICDPLQCADLIAWQRHRKQLNLAEDMDGRKEYKRLHNATDANIFEYREDGMEIFVRHVRERIQQRKREGMDTSPFREG
jgi:hypothetical protein